MKALIAIYSASLLLSALTATRYSTSLRSRGLSLFVPYLWYVFVQEVTLIYLVNVLDIGFSTGLTYNIYMILCVSFFAIIYSRIPFYQPFRKLMYIMMGVYFLLAVIVYAFIRPITEFNFYIILTGGFVITCFALFFLYLYFNLDNRKEEKYWRPMVYITIGVFIFYPVTNIIFTFQEYLLQQEAFLFGMKLHHLVPQLMSIFMYGCFSYAFYLCKRIK